MLLSAHKILFVCMFWFICEHESNNYIILAVHNAKSFIPAGTCLRHLSSVIAMDRDSLIKLYFSLQMSYQDMLTTFALQGIVVGKQVQCTSCFRETC